MEIVASNKEALLKAGLSQEDYNDALDFLNNLGGVK